MNNTTKEKGSKGSLYFIDKITSDNGKDWFLALTWIFAFEIISSLIEFKYLTIARTYVVEIPDGVFKELIIATFVCVFVAHFVYSIINMHKNQFYFLITYALLSLYFYITHDASFNLIFHKIINPFEFEFNGISFYSIIQFVIKLIIIYLIYKMYQGFKNKKS